MRNTQNKKHLRGRNNEKQTKNKLNTSEGEILRNTIKNTTKGETGKSGLHLIIIKPLLTKRVIKKTLAKLGRHIIQKKITKLPSWSSFYRMSDFRIFNRNPIRNNKQNR